MHHADDKYNTIQYTQVHTQYTQIMPYICCAWTSPLVAKGKAHEKKSKKKLTSVSFMYVCVAENVELLVFFHFFLHLPHRQFSFIDLCLSSKMYWTFNCSWDNVMKWNVFFLLRFAHFSKLVCLQFSNTPKGKLLYIHPACWLVNVTINFPSQHIIFPFSSLFFFFSAD